MQCVAGDKLFKDYLIKLRKTQLKLARIGGREFDVMRAVQGSGSIHFTVLTLSV
jgi:hypothetical protein